MCLGEFKMDETISVEGWKKHEAKITLYTFLSKMYPFTTNNWQKNFASYMMHSMFFMWLQKKSQEI